MRQTRQYSLNNVFSLGSICHIIQRDSLKNIHLTPFVRISNSCQDLVQVLALFKGEVILVGSLGNLKECGTCIGYNNGVAIEEQTLKRLDKLVVFDKSW